MPDWNEQFHAMHEQEKAASERTHALEQARQEEKEAAINEAQAKFRSVIEWALDRYRSAGIGPVPIYYQPVRGTRKRWYSKEEKHPSECRQVIGYAYPLQEYDAGDASEGRSDKRVLLVTEDGSHFLAPQAWSSIGQIHYVRETVPTLDAVAFDLLALVSPANPPDTIRKRAEQTCNEIALFVGKRTSTDGGP